MNKRFGLGRRVALIGSTAAIAVASTWAFGVGGAAAADPIPKGKTTIQVKGTLTIPVGDDKAVVPFTGTWVGTSDGAGTITIPKANAKFPDVPTEVLDNPATASIKATTNIVVKVNTTSGLTTAKGTLTTLIDVPGVGAFDCAIGPITTNGSSATSGGSKFKPVGDHGVATVMDKTFGMGAASNPNGSCALAPTITAVVGLPFTSGNASPARTLVQTLTIFPPGAEVPTTTTVATTPTTVAAPVTAAAVDPNAGQLPRTGSSSAPLAVAGVVLVGSGLALVARRRKEASHG